MGTPLSPETKILLRLLEDGQWHPLDEIQAKLSACVAPGKALRRYEDKEAARERLKGPRKTPELTDDEKIASGQRTLANVAINSMRHRFIEVVDDGDRKLIRRRPEPLPASLDIRKYSSQVQAADSPTGNAAPGAGCPRCGLWVVNHVQHAEFHRNYDEPGAAEAGTPAEEPAAAMALFVEADVRTIVRQEAEAAVRAIVRDELDEFQRGMEDWLIKQFEGLEAVLRHKLNQITKRSSPSNFSR